MTEIFSLATFQKYRPSKLQQRAFKTALFAFGGLRIFTLVWMAALSLLIPVNGSQGLTWDPLPSQFVLGVHPLSRLFLLPWYRWDTLRYIQIAKFGYSADLLNTVWPPLYPLLIRMIGFIIPDPMVATLTVSNIATFLGFYLLYILVAKNWNEALSRKTLLYATVFPTAFFFIAGYTESLFLALSIACLIALEQRRWILCGILAGLASLTRVQGVLLIFPLVWEAYRDLLEFPRPVQFRHLVPILIALAVIPLAYGSYAIFVRYGLGSGWPLQSLESGWPVHFDWPWVGIWSSFKHIFFPTPGTEIFLGNIITELVFSLLTITLLIMGWRKLPVTYHLFAWPLLISGISKLTNLNLMVSMPRYVLPIFVIYIVIALKTQKKVFELAWFGISAGAQMFFLTLFYMRSFVG